MTLRERFSTWFGRGSAQPIDFQSPGTQYFGPGIGAQPDHATLLQENMGVADMATRAIANRVASLNPQVKVSRTTVDGTLEDEIIDDHPLKRLIDRPHPDFSRTQLLRLTAQWVVTTGEAYWLKVGSGLRVPVELHPMPPGNVTPRISGGVVAAYSVRDGSGRMVTVPADAVIRFYFPDPANPWGSEGYLGPAGVTADSLKFAGQHLRSHYQNDATPKSWLETDEKAEKFSGPEKKRFLLEWQNAYHARLGSNRGGPGIMPMGYHLLQMAFQSGADIVPLLEHWTDEQLMGFGTPRSILGKVVSGDRSSAETNQYVFDRHTIQPIASLIAEGLTLRLAPDFDEKLFVEFEPFVSDDKQFKLLQEQSDLDRKVKSINLSLAKRGEDPVPWGDLPVGKIGEMPYDASMAFDLPNDEESAFGDGDENEDEDEEGRARLAARGAHQPRDPAESLGSTQAFHARAAFFSPRAEWLRQVAREKKYVPTFESAMFALLAMQKRSVLRKLKAQQPRARVAPGELFKPEEWDEAFEKRLDPIMVAAVIGVAAEALVGLGVEEPFIFTEALRKIIREQGARMVRQVNATTGKRLAKAVSEAQAQVIADAIESGVIAGEGTDAIAKRVQHVFSVRRKEARTIARTEIQKATQQAQLEAFDASGVVERLSWNDAQDADVRDSHRAALIEDVDRGTPFTLAPLPNGMVEQALAPSVGAGGAQLSAANSINCRCFVTPVVEG